MDFHDFGVVGPNGENPFTATHTKLEGGGSRNNIKNHVFADKLRQERRYLTDAVGEAVAVPLNIRYLLSCRRRNCMKLSCGREALTEASSILRHNLYMAKLTHPPADIVA